MMRETFQPGHIRRSTWDGGSRGETKRMSMPPIKAETVRGVPKVDKFRHEFTVNPRELQTRRSEFFFGSIKEENTSGEAQLSEDGEFIFELEDGIKSPKKSSNLKSKSKESIPSFLEAAKRGDSNLLKEILLDTSIEINLTYHGFTALHLACANSQTECVKILLEHGADVNLRDHKGKTALHKSAGIGDVESIHNLVRAGATLSKDDKRNRAFHSAAKANQSEALEALLSYPEFVRKINSKNEKKQTVVHLSCVHPDSRCLNVLMKIPEIDYRITDRKKQNALHICCAHKNETAAKLLMEKEPSLLNIQDEDGNTPIHILTSMPGCEKFLAYFMRWDVKLELKNKEGKTPLHIATEKGSESMCNILVNKGADVSIRYRLASSKKDRNANGKVSHDRYGFILREVAVETKGSKRASFLSGEKQNKRSLKWQDMLQDWSNIVEKKPYKIKKRVRKGIPETVRGKAWVRLAESESLHLDPKHKGLYQKLIEESTKWSSLIDKDINRTLRTHIQFSERFGPGQISLFNVLKAYANYDKEVGYCQGMSGVTGLLLMFVPEQEAFWLLVKIMSDKKYCLRGRFIDKFADLKKSFWVHEQLLRELCPKLHAHFEKESISTSYYTVRWYMLVFFGVLPFACVVRLWDLFMYEGYPLVYSIAMSLLKKFERKLLKMKQEGIFLFLNSLDKSKEWDTEGFIKYVLNHKISKKKIRKLEFEYDNKLN